MKRILLATAILSLAFGALTSPALANGVYPPHQPHACDGLKPYDACGVRWYNRWYNSWQRGQCFPEPGKPEAPLSCVYAL